MLVYDVTKEESFDNITNWIRDIEEVSHNINLQTVLWSATSWVFFFISIVCL